MLRPALLLPARSFRHVGLLTPGFTSRLLSLGCGRFRDLLRFAFTTHHAGILVEEATSSLLSGRPGFRGGWLCQFVVHSNATTEPLMAVLEPSLAAMEPDRPRVRAETRAALNGIRPKHAQVQAEETAVIEAIRQLARKGNDVRQPDAPVSPAESPASPLSQPSPRPSPVESAPARGDGVELAGRLLALLGRGAPAILGEGRPSIVFDEGVFYEYESARGLWVPLTELGLSLAIQSFAGTPAGLKGKPLSIRAPDVAGAVKLASAQAAAPGFFAGGKSGVAFTHGFVVVDGEGIDLHAHSPEHRARVGLPFPFALNAPRARWEQYLAEVFRDDADAAAKIELLQEFGGACVCGVATKYARALILLGDGRNGKSVFLQVVSKLFAPEAVAAIPPQDWDNEYRREALRAVRLNAVNELPRADILRGEAVKAIISGDAISGRPIYGSLVTVHPRAGHIFAANGLPGSDDVSRAFWERFIVIRFDRFFAEAQRDTTLADTIIRTELPGVAAWAIEGAARLLARGPKGTYTIPPSHQEALGDWRLSADQVAQYLADRTTSAASPEERVTGENLYRDYRLWALENGHSPLSNTKFAQRVRALGHRPVKPKSETLYPLKLCRAGLRTLRPVG